MASQDWINVTCISLIANSQHLGFSALSTVCFMLRFIFFGESKGHRFSGVATDLILFLGEALGRESLLECILIKAEDSGFLDK